MQKTLNAAIIGAGSIGGLIDTPKSVNIASHAHAYIKEPSCSLVAICEPNQANQKEFMKRWGKVNTYKTSNEMFVKENINILSISSPTRFHSQNLSEALYVKTISYILCEKPLVQTQKELDELQLQNSDKKILINLIRRYDPSFIKLASMIKKQKWGKVLDFHGVFTKGLLHNGVHMLDVLTHFFGEISDLIPLHVNRIENDLSGEFYIKLLDAQGFLRCIEPIDYSLFELDIVFENAKVEIKEGGNKINIYEKEPSDLYENYFTLKYKETLENTLQYYAKNSLDFLIRENSSTCKAILKEHIKLHSIIFQALQKANKK